MLEIPGESTHNESRITRHEVNVIDAGCFVPQPRLKEKCCLFPFRIEEILDEQKCLELAVRKSYGKHIPFSEVEDEP